MLTYNHLFSDMNEFISFINHSNINNETKVIVQIYSSSTKQVIAEIDNIVTRKLHSPIVFGIFTNYILFDGQIHENATMISLTLLDHMHYHIIHQSHNDFSELDIPKSLYHQPSLPSNIQLLSLLEPIHSQLLVDTIKNILPNTIVHGGILHSDSVIYYNQTFYSQGYIGLLFFGPSLISKRFNTTSIISIGREHTITKAKDQTIKYIDQIPAKLFYERYLGLNQNPQSQDFGYTFPFLLERDTQLLPSTIQLSKEDNTIISKLPVKPGDKITIGYCDVNYFVNEVRLLSQYLPTIPCEYLMVFASEKRTLELFSHLKNKKINLPLFGLLTSYEFINHENSVYLTSENMTLNCVSGSPSNFLKIEPIQIELKQTPAEIEHSVLLKLMENTSKELNSLNKTLENIVTEKTMELSDHYYTDQLTKLPNLNQLVENLLADDAFCLCLIDISSFININNFYGTTIGNKVLIELAELITQYSNSNNFTTYRVHSDIFAVVGHDSGYKLFCNRMRLLQTRIHKHCFINQHQQIYINTIMGLSNMQLALYENASMTLEHAKSEKMTFLIYNEQLKIEESIISNLTWSNKIRHAIDHDKIVPFYQPIYNNETNKIDRFEVLMRLIDEEGCVVSPILFLPIAKKAGLYTHLTKIIIQKAFNYFEDKPYQFSINLSADDITNPRTRSYIYNRLIQFSRPYDVIFEIVESESIENFETIVNFINEIKRHGASIAIDDFGTGFSNFHYLFKLNVDCIKIDGSIIQHMQSDISCELVAETIVSFANKMGISTVAEYVSDESIFNKTKEMGISYSQGYYVAHPAANILM